MTNYATLVVAGLCHEVNRAYCAALGDLSQPWWPEAPEWQRASAVAGVEAALSNPDQTPEKSHAGWMAQKVADGWVWGPVKDPERKQHPCMVPYAELPPEQRVKDALFLGVVRASQMVGIARGHSDMEDIATRLRWLAENDPLITEAGYAEELVEAADEIYRLRSVLSSVYHDLDRISRPLAGSWGGDDD